MQECDVYIGKGLKLAGTRNSVIAPGFSAYVEYKKGQLVMRDGDLYVAPKDLAPGPWNDEDWVQTSLGQEIPRKTSQLENDNGFVSNTHKNKWYDITSMLGSASNSVTSIGIYFYFNPFLMLIRFSLWCNCSSTSNINVFNFFDDVPSNSMLGLPDTLGRTEGGVAIIARIQATTGIYAKHVNISSSSSFSTADTFNSIGCPNDTIHDYLASKGFVED